MSRAEELRAKADRLKARQDARGVSAGSGDDRTEQDRDQALVASAAAPHVKPVRSTVDLPPVRHAQLKAWCGETAVMVGKSRVTTQDVFRALVTRLLNDETMARKIRDDLRADSQ